jgi:uncharacterized protein
MSFLPVLLELQSIHDNLTIIQRDLSSFPPEMAKLDTDLKAFAKRMEMLSKSLEGSRADQATLTRNLTQVQKLEDTARVALKNSTQKIQYTAAIRELDERERQKTAVAKPLKDVEARIQTMEAELADITAQHGEARERFDTLHSAFLDEHQNQVAAREQAMTRKRELEGKLEPIELTRFNRLLVGRHGQAVVAVENGTCTGCRTRLRGPFLALLREKTVLNCESCQRILYVPPKA